MKITCIVSGLAISLGSCGLFVLADDSDSASKAVLQLVLLLAVEYWFLSIPVLLLLITEVDNGKLKINFVAVGGLALLWGLAYAPKVAPETVWGISGFFLFSVRGILIGRFFKLVNGILVLPCILV